VQWITLDCDPIAPAYCGHPFPSNVFTIDDDAAPTGRRVALSAAMMPTTRAGVQALPDTWSSLSGCTPDNQTDPCVGL
jgi:hypothetical protein